MNNKKLVAEMEKYRASQPESDLTPEEWARLQKKMQSSFECEIVYHPKKKRKAKGVKPSSKRGSKKIN